MDLFELHNILVLSAPFHYLASSVGFICFAVKSHGLADETGWKGNEEWDGGEEDCHVCASAHASLGSELVRPHGIV
jgi:hypothetical protein